jgi:UDP-N-acetylmuramoyl-L-alanyl-D-glutamate--2,6-diaminopimelate ligase
MNFRKLIKKFLPSALFAVIEPYGHLIEAIIWNVINGFPAKDLKIIGVTGTNGKTSTCYLIHRMLYESGYKVGLMTTVGYGVNEDIKPQIEHMTTVSVPLLMRRLKEMKANNIDWLVLETTSHALAQNRVWGIPFSVAVMTNVTHEHLDYHKTFERYRDAKRKLFKLTNKNKHGLVVGVVNIDDPSSKLFASDIASPILYGLGKGDVVATDIKLRPEAISYKAKYKNNLYNIVCRLPGSFNVANSLAAICVGISLGLNKEQIEKGIAALEGVEGRMTTIKEGQDFSVIVDFAHSPDSFEKLFNDLRPVIEGKMIVLFGSAGRRDVTKRAEQGRLAGKYADEVIITEEDDRDVDGMKIMDQIASGAEQAGKARDKNLFLVLDREEAIAFALKRAHANDTVLLLGKGHEKTIERADGEHPWNEIETTRKLLRQL